MDLLFSIRVYAEKNALRQIKNIHRVYALFVKRTHEFYYYRLKIGNEIGKCSLKIVKTVLTSMIMNKVRSYNFGHVTSLKHLKRY